MKPFHIPTQIKLKHALKYFGREIPHTAGKFYRLPYIFQIDDKGKIIIHDKSYLRSAKKNIKPPNEK